MGWVWDGCGCGIGWGPEGGSMMEADMVRIWDKWWTSDNSGQMCSGKEELVIKCEEATHDPRYW